MWKEESRSQYQILEPTRVARVWNREMNMMGDTTNPRVERQMKLKRSAYQTRLKALLVLRVTVLLSPNFSRAGSFGEWQRIGFQSI